MTARRDARREELRAAAATPDVEAAAPASDDDIARFSKLQKKKKWLRKVTFFLPLLLARTHSRLTRV
jgi:hypothetical protein